MKIQNLNVGVITKYREYYIASKKLGGLITLHTVTKVDMVGEEIHLNCPQIDKFDQVFVNGHKFVPEEKEKQ